jgi:hypothetical protein
MLLSYSTMWVGPYTDKLHLRLSLTSYEFRQFRKGQIRNIVQYMYFVHTMYSRCR